MATDFAFVIKRVEPHSRICKCFAYYGLGCDTQEWNSLFLSEKPFHTNIGVSVKAYPGKWA